MDLDGLGCPADFLESFIDGVPTGETHTHTALAVESGFSEKSKLGVRVGEGL